MDWQLCVVCGGGGNLKCPAESNQKNGLEVYRNFLHSVEEFEAVQSLPQSGHYQYLWTSRVKAMLKYS